MLEIERRIGESFIGTVSNIKKAHELGSEGDDPVAIISRQADGQNTVYWLPLNKDQAFHSGDQVKVTPIWKHFTSGGILTEYAISLDLH